MFSRVGFGLPRVPLEHLLSIYGMPDPLVFGNFSRHLPKVEKRIGGAATPEDTQAAPGAGSGRSRRLHNGSKNWVDFGGRGGVAGIRCWRRKLFVSAECARNARLS